VENSKVYHCFNNSGRKLGDIEYCFNYFHQKRYCGFNNLNFFYFAYALSLHQGTYKGISGSFEVKIACGGRQPQLLHTQN